MKPDDQHVEVHYSGRVQGIGFRFTTQALAAGYQVTGYVKNLSDGRVELVVEGPPAEIDGLLSAVELRLGRYVRAAQQTRLSASGQFSRFDIRY